MPPIGCRLNPYPTPYARSRRPRSGLPSLGASHDGVEPAEGDAAAAGRHHHDPLAYSSGSLLFDAEGYARQAVTGRRVKWATTMHFGRG